MSNARTDQLVRESLVQDNANARTDQLVREAFVAGGANARVDQLVREAFVSLQSSNATVDQLVREAFVGDTANVRVNQVLREGYCQDTPHARIRQLVREAFISLAGPTTVTPNMPITYPLTIPSTLGEAKANLKKIDAIGEFISEFVGTAEQQQWQDQHWELDLEWPPMKWAQFAAYDAFIGALHGKFGTFLWGPPWGTAPRGSGSGSPLLGQSGVFTGPGSETIATNGWAPSASGLLLPGDFLQIGPFTAAISWVEIVAGALSVGISGLSGNPDLVIGLPVLFSGVDTATWLNGGSSDLECDGVGFFHQLTDF